MNRQLIPKNCFMLVMLLMAMICRGQLGPKTIGNYYSTHMGKEVKGKSVVTKIYFHSNGSLLTIEDNLTEIGYPDPNPDTISALKDKVLKFTFRGITEGNLKQIAENNRSKDLIRIEGTLSINNITKNYVAYYAPIIIDPASDNILLNFDIKFTLADFNLLAENFLFNDLVELKIENGFVSRSE